MTSARGTWLVLLWMVGRAGAAVWWVSPAGSDQAAGTATQPWRTVQAAASRARAGDTVFVTAGQYPERVRLTSGGAAGAPLSLVARGAVQVAGFDLEQVSHVRLVGFEITGVAPGNYGIFLADAHHCELLHNTIHHVPLGALRFYQGRPCHHNVVRGNRISYTGHGGRGELALTISGDQNLIEHNDLSHVFDFVVIFGQRNIVRNNYWHDAYWADHPGQQPHIDGIQHYVGTNYFPRVLQRAVVEANLMEDVPDQHTHFAMLEEGARLGSGDLLFRRNVGRRLGGYALLIEEVQRVRVVHNTFVDLFLAGPQRAWYCLGYTGGAVGGQVQHNLFVNAARPGGQVYFADEASRPGLVGDYNLVFGGGNPREVHGLVDRDPLLTGVAEGDFAPAAGSPASDAGGSLTTTTRGGTGTLVPVVDAGCFCDGYGLVEGDRVRIGDVAAELVQVDYAANTLTLSDPVGFAAGTPVTYDYAGAGPDLGAVEVGESRAPLRLTAVTARRTAGGLEVTAQLPRPAAARHVELWANGRPVARSRPEAVLLRWDDRAEPAADLLLRAYAAEPSRVLWVDAPVPGS
ncbi:MAG: right-handed parallel beta-helix repeat-containing protein [Fimbriimonadaceae bacterium]|nr:right-handed parallel beta-helix repeat-containing protein [Fimbriimonadaceae bacterium]